MLLLQTESLLVVHETESDIQQRQGPTCCHYSIFLFLSPLFLSPPLLLRERERESALEILVRGMEEGEAEKKSEEVARLRVLVVDDSALDRKIVERLIKRSDEFFEGELFES